MSKKQVTIVGGGAAGFFAAIHCKGIDPEAQVTILEKSAELLAKVVISGGGRCNVTHACFDPKALTAFYPRGSRELLGPFHHWNPADTVDWFEQRGVELKVEADGRMFPVTDSSLTIMNCLLDEAKALGVEVLINHGLQAAVWDEARHCFELTVSGGANRTTNFLLLASGGNQRSGGLAVAESLGHQIVPPVPSLFTFHIKDPLLSNLSGITVEQVAASVAGRKLQQSGPLLITHWGLSGPAILKLSAWGARELAELNYRFELRINWLPELKRTVVEEEINAWRKQKGARVVAKASPFSQIPKRLWERMTSLAGMDAELIWSQLPRAQHERLLEILVDSRLQVTKKSMNKEEFVTCGGVTLKQVNMKTMESRIVPGLYFAGEVLDIDGVTGGFNFQAAWTGGYLAGRALGAVG